jgi:hypothetical protein
MAKSKKTKGDLQKKLRVRHKLINTNFAYNGVISGYTEGQGVPAPNVAPVMVNHERGKDQIVITSNGTYSR